MKNLIFDVHEIINKPMKPDLWIIYKPDLYLKYAYSLQMLLWELSFDNSSTVKNYKLKHSLFYKIFDRKD